MKLQSIAAMTRLPETIDTAQDRDGKSVELDRLLNDPEVPMQAARVWDLLDEIAARSPNA